MIRLLLFFKKIYVVLVFIGLEVLCLSIFFSNNPYQKAQSLSVSNHILGAVHEKMAGVSDYFSLAERNGVLMDENARLMRELAELRAVDTLLGAHGAMLNDSIPVRVVRVVRNQTNMRDNFITISSGTKDGIEPDMALYNSDGIVGYVVSCSENFSIAVSILNHSGFHSSGKIKGTDFMGPLSWNGIHPRIVDLNEVPIHSGIVIGDTILTTLYSNIFPENLPVGVVISAEIINGTYYNSKVRLFADMSSLTYLYAVKLLGQEERERLETQIPNTQ